MLAGLIEAVLRSLILALIVWAGLRIFRIRNVVSQRYAWAVVLVGSLLMPFALPFTARWHVVPVAMMPAPPLLAFQEPTFPISMPKVASEEASSTGPMIVAHRRDRNGSLPGAKANPIGNWDRASSSAVLFSFRSRYASGHIVPIDKKVSVLGVALGFYFLIAIIFLARLVFGLAGALRLWHSSIPVTSDGAAHIGDDFNVRFSHRISSPVTIGSGIVLPADYTGWTAEKLRVVLAHEQSHVSLRDFHLQILASLYAAVTWFSPLGWWLKRKLSNLGEAISDRSGLNAASNRSAYAQILLEFAAEPRPTLIGVAMARPSSISRRIEELFNDSYLRQAFSGSTAARVTVLILVTVLFATGTIVHVQAATESSTIGKVAAATAVIPAAAPAVSALSREQSGLLISQTTSEQVRTASSATPLPQSVREIALANPPAPPSSAALLGGGEGQAVATFDRSLSVNGVPDLTVSTASGDITFTRGAANQIRIHGVVKANKNGDPAQVQRIAANPPIEQEGNTIRIGAHEQNFQNISISYEIEAPADTMLNAVTASGDISDTGVGKGPKMTTASGDIKATGLQDGFTVQSSSGDIVVDNAGQGNATAQTGSGDIDVKGVGGALRAETGSGTIKAAGTPSSPWKLQTGSGDIELLTGRAPMNLDASTGSGNISAPSSIATQTSKDHQHLRAPLNGGGPEVRAATGSGDIRID